MTAVTLVRDDALSTDALAMIAMSEAELASIYPAEVRYAFSPKQLTDAEVRFLTAYREDAVIGCGGVAPCDGFAELKRIFVIPDARGSGVAGQIVAGLEAIARADGYHTMRLETGEDSPDAIALYTKLGYVRIGAFGTYEENGSSVFMEKAL